MIRNILLMNGLLFTGCAIGRWRASHHMDWLPMWVDFAIAGVVLSIGVASEIAERRRRARAEIPC